MAENNDLHTELVHLARMALAGRRQDVLLLIRRLARKTQKKNPLLSKQLSELLTESPTNSSPIRGNQAESIPVDHDSRLQLARVEFPTLPLVKPIWTEHLRHNLEQVISERENEVELFSVGLHPTKSLLFTGPPGVGKSLAANWLAAKLNRPLVILDLSAVMSSYLGRTGNNLRQVLDYAKSVQCVLLLDEFDAIAKRRDDSGEIGELKRLVTVLLQEIDDFPETGLLIAATNHPDLLDPAVWRRFEMVLQFPLPNENQTKAAIKAYLGEENGDYKDLIDVLSLCFKESSFSDIQRSIQLAKREAVIKKVPLNQSIGMIVQQRTGQLSRLEKAILVQKLTEWGFSHRKIHSFTGVARESISKYARSGGITNE
jgi:SpoVK/Ycf46/Vps4 family AAA+-type ATPase